MATINLYSKEQTDALLASKANQATTYTKNETDALLGTKANSADVYTKTEANTLLGTKANSADVYTKTEVDTAISNKGPTKITCSTLAEFEAQIPLLKRGDIVSVIDIGNTDNNVVLTACSTIYYGVDNFTGRHTFTGGIGWNGTHNITLQSWSYDPNAHKLYMTYATNDAPAITISGDPDIVYYPIIIIKFAD